MKDQRQRVFVNRIYYISGYGYGSLATVITCLCSVIGALVVKCSSDKAYGIIMALFLGLAVGTLYTDAMIHLLPMVLKLIF